MVIAAGPALGSQPTTAPVRDPLWDNLRVAAIALVVVGHTIEAAGSYDPAYSLYLFIYAFHMPLFAFISGYFARAEPLTVTDGRKIVTQLLAPYVVFSLVWAGLRWVVEGRLILDLTSPYWHLWFLPALALWRLSLPVFASLRAPGLVAVAVACLSGYFAVGWLFDASRVLGMVPFFVLGWALKSSSARERVLEFLRWGPVRLASLAVLLLGLAAAFWMVAPAREHRLRAWTQTEKNYAAIGFGEWWAGGVRLLLILVALVLLFAIISVTPSSATPVTSWGGSTMYVYLLHLFAIYFLQRSDLYDSVDSLGSLLALVVGAVVLTALLSTPVVRALFRVLVEPPMGWLLRANR